jgi:chaperonin GroES
MTVVTQDVVEVATEGELIHIDTQGERMLRSTDALALASRLIDAAVQVSDTNALRPLMDRVIVRVIEEANRVSGGGVFLPDNAAPEMNRGIVLAVGPGRVWFEGGTKHTEPVTGIAVGDIVTFSRHAGYEIVLGNLPFRGMWARDVLAIVETP